MEQFGRVPEQGDRFEYKGLEIEVTQVGKSSCGRDPRKADSNGRRRDFRRIE